MKSCIRQVLIIGQRSFDIICRFWLHQTFLNDGKCFYSEIHDLDTLVIHVAHSFSLSSFEVPFFLLFAILAFLFISRLLMMLLLTVPFRWRLCKVLFMWYRRGDFKGVVEEWRPPPKRQILVASKKKAMRKNRSDSDSITFSLDEEISSSSSLEYSSSLISRIEGRGVAHLFLLLFLLLLCTIFKCLTERIV